MTRRRALFVGALAVLLAILLGVMLGLRAEAPLPSPDAPAAASPGAASAPRQQRDASPDRPPAPSSPEAPTIADLPADVLEHLKALGYLDDAKGAVEVFVTLPDGDNPPFALVRTCDGRHVPAPDGFARFQAKAGTCTLQAWRRDGLLRAWSDQVDVEVVAGESVEAELTLPQERTGGLGVTIRSNDRGIEVAQVHEGTPAWDMGLQPGDVIVEVDGLPTAALTLEEFIQVMTGPEGTRVKFVVGYGSDTGWREEPLELTRVFLGEDLR